MSRLIDADELMEEIRSYRMTVTGLRARKGVLNECMRHFSEGILKIINEQPTVNAWIPCSERLPENISTVIVQVKEIEKPTVGWYGNMDGWRLTERDFAELKDFTVIAWIPLPTPYHPNKCHGCFGAANNDCERCIGGNV